MKNQFQFSKCLHVEETKLNLWYYVQEAIRDSKEISKTNGKKIASIGKLNSSKLQKSFKK